MSHEVQSRFGVSCPNSTGSFYVCEKKPIRFVGCCTVDPCKTEDGNCPDDELVTTSFDQYSYNQLQKQDCVSDDPDVEWYTCAANNPPFMGCCAVNPCAEGECPDRELYAAKLNDDDKLAALFLPDDYKKDGGGLSTGATAGIGVGAALGGIAIISVLVFFFLKRRKRNQQEAAAATAATQPDMHQHQPQSPHRTMASSPLDKQFGGSAGQPSPYAATFMSSPSMQQHLSSHMSWDGAQSNASFAPSPYLPGQSPPMGQNGFPPSAYGGGGGYQHYGGYQPQQQQQQPSYTELDGGDDGVHRPSELANTTIPERDDEVSRVTSPSHGEEGPGSPTYGRR
jgi:hypothetical protein